ncbi:hypothetical protein DDR33_12375 [Pararcticibacter amylolyticus]|uniref:Uncharacterized protein n=1 Tax=Pararcticibacter amylolyticus TaxID=2173175 RepID=A0A2U2PG62_9SPHI|nr:hypothetical protein DDR33_12375 [Pararcticibacter amylolyticus]
MRHSGMKQNPFLPECHIAYQISSRSFTRAAWITSAKFRAAACGSLLLQSYSTDVPGESAV